MPNQGDPPPAPEGNANGTDASDDDSMDSTAVPALRELVDQNEGAAAAGGGGGGGGEETATSSDEEEEENHLQDGNPSFASHRSNQSSDDSRDDSEDRGASRWTETTTVVLGIVRSNMEDVSEISSGTVLRDLAEEESRGVPQQLRRLEYHEFVSLEERGEDTIITRGRRFDNDVNSLGPLNTSTEKEDEDSDEDELGSNGTHDETMSYDDNVQEGSRDGEGGDDEEMDCDG